MSGILQAMPLPNSDLTNETRSKDRLSSTLNQILQQNPPSKNSMRQQANPQEAKMKESTQGDICETPPLRVVDLFRYFRAQIFRGLGEEGPEAKRSRSNTRRSGFSHNVYPLVSRSQSTSSLLNHARSYCQKSFARTIRISRYARLWQD